MKSSFLRWCLVNVLFIVALTAAMLGYDGHVHPAGELAVAAVLVVYVLAAANCGLLAWRDACGPTDHIALAIRACPMLSMLGTVAGFLIAFSGGSENVQERVLGASTGLVATFVGISCALVLMLQQHLLDA